jgi:hypothetical protein
MIWGRASRLRDKGPRRDSFQDWKHPGGLPYFGLAWQRLIASAGVAPIVLIMLGAATRRDESHEQHYVAIEEFRACALAR